MDDDSAESRVRQLGRYANFFKIGYNEYEFVLDFGQSFGDAEPPALHTRIITSKVYVNGLCRTLRDAVDDYEAEFGKLPDPEVER